MTDYADLTDEELVRRMQEGDTDALRALCDRYSDLLRARIRRWLPAAVQRRVSVADVLQESWLVVHDRRNNFEERGEGAFRRWILGIAEMKARRAVQRHATKKRAAHRELTHGQREDTAQFVSPGASPSQEAMGAELEAIAQKALDALPEDYRQILHLVRERQLTLREAAERMGRSREATKKLYGRALARFTEEFEELRGD